MTKTKQMRVNDKHKEFTGTTNYYRISLLDRNVLGTDGVVHIADTYGAYWLLHVIASHIRKVKDDFVVILLDHEPSEDNDDQFVFSIQDDIPYNKRYVKQIIPYSDFPEMGVQFYAQKNGDQWVIYLPSEH